VNGVYAHVWERYGRKGTFTFVRALKDRMEEHGVSQGKLARRTGFHPTHVSRWLREVVPASLETKLILDEALDQIIVEEVNL